MYLYREVVCLFDRAVVHLHLRMLLLEASAWAASASHMPALNQKEHAPRLLVCLVCFGARLPGERCL